VRGESIPGRFQDLCVAAVNVKRLRGDYADPDHHRERPAGWE